MAKRRVSRMRKLKWILGGFFAFVIALLVAGYIVIANYPVEDLKALIQQQAQEVTGRKLEIRGNAKVDVSFSPSILLEDVHFQNAPWAVGEDMVSMARFEIEVDLWPLLSGEIRVKRFNMVDPVIALQRDAEGRGNWELGSEEQAQQAKDKAQEGLTNLPSFQSVTFTNARIVFKDDQAGTQRTLLLKSLEAKGRDLVSPVAVTAAGSLDEVPFDLAIDLGSVEQMASGTAFPLTLKGTLADANLSLTGSVAPPSAASGNDVTLSLAGPSLATLGKLAGVELPPAGPYSLEAHLLQHGEVYSLNGLKATLGGSDLAGNITADLGGARPRIDGELISKHLALPDLRGGEAPGSGEAAEGKGLFPDDPFPVELLRTLDGKLEINAAELVISTTTLKQVKMTVEVANGLLTITPISIGYGEATIDGGVTLDASKSPPTLAVQMKGSGLSLAEASGGAMTGNLSIDLDLTAVGDSPKAWASSLTGHSEIASSDGRIDSKLLAVASAPLAGAFGPLFGGSSEVKLNCLVNRFAWNKGIGTNQGTAIDASTFSVIGNGTVNLKSETIDFYVDTWSKDTALVGLAVPVTVRGSLVNPSIAPDPAGTALGIAKTAGLIVFPPAGLAAIIDDRAEAQQGNACVAVTREVQEKGGPDSFFKGVGDAAGSILKDAGDAAKDAGDSIEKGAEDAVKGLKSIFN